MQYTLEVCVDSIESALAAAESGADRLELANCLDAGGVSPSYAFIATVCRRIPTCKIHVLIRPRCGDFVYSQDEIDLMRYDVIQCAGLGVHGIVSGFLHPNGTIDPDLTCKFVDLCKALSKSFFFLFIIYLFLLTFLFFYLFIFFYRLVSFQLDIYIYKQP